MVTSGTLPRAPYPTPLPPPSTSNAIADRVAQPFLPPQLTRKRAKGLEPRHDGLVEAALFAVRPPARHADRWRKPPLMERYVMHLLLERLNGPSDVQDVAASLASLPWVPPLPSDRGRGGDLGATEGDAAGEGPGPAGEDLALSETERAEGGEGEGERPGVEGGEEGEGAVEDAETPGRGRSTEGMVVDVLLRSSVARFSAVGLLGAVVAGVARYRESVGVAVVDACIEGVLGSLERGGVDYQRRVALVSAAPGLRAPAGID